MVERVLPYDRAIVPQETGHWCGPAAAQIVLDSVGIRVPEAELAREIGTTVDGTNTIEWLVDRSFAHRVPQAGYRVVWLPRDPPTDEQRELLWEHLTRSVEAGWGVPMNWWAAEWNYPVGVKGSVSPRYPVGNVVDGFRGVKHYVAAMGYYTGADVPGGRAVWIADSANFGGIQGYWISFDQCCRLIPPMAYAWASSSPAVTIAPPAPPPASAALDVLIAAMQPSEMGRDRFAQMLPGFAEAMRAAQITTVRRAAAWCSQIGQESSGLEHMAEIQTSHPSWSEDRTRYRGRGPIQLTWESNYRRFGQWLVGQGYLSDSELFVREPELVEQPKWGFLASSWYWLYGGPKPGQINGFADAGDILAVSRCVNGWIENRDPVGWLDRRARWDSCLAMGDRLLTLIAAEPEPEPVPAPPPAPVAPTPVTPAVPEPAPPLTVLPSADELREILTLLRALVTEVRSLVHDQWSSLSPFRPLDYDDAATLAQRLALVDSHTHIGLTINLAMMGDPEHLRLLSQIASAAEDPGRWPDRQEHARLARLVLDYVEAHGVTPAAPVFTCAITDSPHCARGGTERCALTASGRCLRVEYGQLAGGGAILNALEKYA